MPLRRSSSLQPSSTDCYSGSGQDAACFTEMDMGMVQHPIVCPAGAGAPRHDRFLRLSPSTSRSCSLPCCLLARLQARGRGKPTTKNDACMQSLDMPLASPSTCTYPITCYCVPPTKELSIPFLIWLKSKIIQRELIEKLHRYTPAAARRSPLRPRCRTTCRQAASGHPTTQNVVERHSRVPEKCHVGKLGEWRGREEGRAQRCNETTFGSKDGRGDAQDVGSHTGIGNLRGVRRHARVYETVRRLR